jgi:hypothetical protein
VKEWFLRTLANLALVAFAIVAGFFLSAWLVPVPPPRMDGYVPAFVGAAAAGFVTAIALGLRAVLRR